MTSRQLVLTLGLLLMGISALPPTTARAQAPSVSIVRTSSPIFYVDTKNYTTPGEDFRGAYVSFRVTNTSPTETYQNLIVTIDGFAVSVQASEKLDRSDHLEERDRQFFADVIEGRAWTPSAA